MGNIAGDPIIIRLDRQPTDDGRIYVTSPDLPGFSFVLEMDEDPFETMLPTIWIFASRALDADLAQVRPARAVAEYRAHKHDDHALDRGFPHTLVSAVA